MRSIFIDKKVLQFFIAIPRLFVFRVHKLNSFQMILIDLSNIFCLDFYNVGDFALLLNTELTAKSF